MHNSVYLAIGKYHIGYKIATISYRSSMSNFNVVDIDLIDSVHDSLAFTQRIPHDVAYIKSASMAFIFDKTRGPRESKPRFVPIYR